MSYDYGKLLDMISRASGIEKEEIEKKVEAKRTKLSGLVSKEGAAQIVAAELGINFENEKLKISELSNGLKRANVIGKVTKIFPVREFNKNGREGKIGSFLLGDESSNIRVVMWDSNHISLIESGKIGESDVVEIKTGNVKNGELHLSGFSDIRLSNEKLENVKTNADLPVRKLKDMGAGQSARVRAVIVQVFEPRHFESKNERGGKNVLLNLVLDDGTETMRAVLFGEQINNLGLSDEELISSEKFIKKKDEILGEEKIFSGNLRVNNFLNNLEMNVNEVREIKPEELVKELETTKN